MEIYTVPGDLIFHPCRVSGDFWGELSGLLLILTDPHILCELYDTDKEKYFEAIEPLHRFITETENDLKKMGKLVKKDLPDEN